MATPSKSTPVTEPSIAGTSLTSTSSRKRPLKYVCEYADCGKAFDRPVRLTEHQRSHTGERPFVCSDKTCGKTFLKNEHLKHHIKTKHTTDSRDHLCDYIITVNGVDQPCGKTFHTGSRLRRHRAMHEDKESTKCHEPGCGKVFRKQETLQKHIQVDHLGGKPYVCDHVVNFHIEDDQEAERCGKGFMTVGMLRAHEGREHQGQRYFCSLCSDETSTIPEDENTIDFSAPSMDQENKQVGFATYAELQAHNNEVHPPTCEQCKKVCKSSKALKAHMEIEHSALEDRHKFFCDYPDCGRGFTKSGNLKVHIQTVHVQSKRFTCGETDLSKSKRVPGWDGRGCGRGFGTKANLEGHVRTQHLGLPIDRKKIKSEPDSSNHGREDDRTLALLTGVGYEDNRPIACMVESCTKRFTRDYDLEQHLELTHGWNVDDIADRVAEREALNGEKFWIGGADDADGMDEDERFERQLADRLTFSNSQEEQMQLERPALEPQEDEDEEMEVDEELFERLKPFLPKGFEKHMKGTWEIEGAESEDDNHETYEEHMSALRTRAEELLGADEDSNAVIDPMLA